MTLTKQDFLDAAADLATLQEATNVDATISPRVGSDFNSLPKEIRLAGESATTQFNTLAATLTELLQANVYADETALTTALSSLSLGKFVFVESTEEFGFVYDNSGANAAKLVPLAQTNEGIGNIVKELLAITSVDSFAGGTGLNNGSFDAETGTYSIAGNTFGGMTLTDSAMEEDETALLTFDKTEGLVAFTFNLLLRASGSTVQEISIPKNDGAESISVQITSNQAIDEIRLNTSTQGGGSATTLNNFKFYRGTLQAPLLETVPTIIQTELTSLTSRTVVLEAASAQGITTNSEHNNRLIALEQLNTLRHALAQVQALAFNNAVYVNTNGDDLNAGTVKLPYATYSKAAEEAEDNGKNVVIQAAQRFSAYREHSLDCSHLTGFPAVGAKPEIANLLDLSGVTFTLDSGSIWTVDVELSDVPPDNVLQGASALSFHLGVFVGDTSYDYIVGEGSIAANKAAMGSGSFTAHFVGSTEEDLRGDIANKTTSVRIFVRMADDSDPNATDIRFTDYIAFPVGLDTSVKGGSVCNIRTGFNTGKDNQNFSLDDSGVPPILSNTEALHVTQHGSVGPCHIAGKHVVICRGVPGVGNYLSSEGNVIRRGSGGVNIYTATYRPDLILYWEELDVTNAGAAVYGHGSSPANQGYAGLVIGKLKVFNANSGVSFDVPTTNQPWITDGTVIGVAELDQIDAAFNPCGNLTVNSGYAYFADDYYKAPGPANALVKNFVTTEALTWSFKNFAATVNRTYTPFSTEARLFDTVAPASGRHTLILDGFTDKSVFDKKLHFPRGNNVTHKVKLVIKGGTSLGDLQPKSQTNVWVEEIEVEPGIELGFGGRDFDALVSALNTAGVTHNFGDYASTDFSLVAARQL